MPGARFWIGKLYWLRTNQSYPKKCLRRSSEPRFLFARASAASKQLPRWICFWLLPSSYPRAKNLMRLSTQSYSACVPWPGRTSACAQSCTHPGEGSTLRRKWRGRKDAPLSALSDRNERVGRPRVRSSAALCGTPHAIDKKSIEQ